MNESKKQTSKIGSALVGVVVEIPFETEHDLESVEAVQDIIDSKLAKDVIAALLGGILAHQHDNEDDIKIWYSSAIAEVGGVWTEYNG